MFPISDLTDQALYGCRGYGEIGYSESKIFTYVYPKTTTGFKIKFYNTSGVKIGEIGSDIKDNTLLNLSFDHQEIGCGAFSLKLENMPSFTIGYRTRIDVHLFNDPLPWYSGYVFNVPKSNSTTKFFNFSGFGFYYQLVTCMINASYSSQEIASIVTSLMTTYVEANTDIVYDSTLIDTVGYTVNEIDFSYTNAKKAFEQLAEMAQNYVYGVNEYRKFFFNPIDTAVNVNAIKIVGKHLKEFLPEEDSSEIYNKIYVLAGEITDGSNYICTAEDAASQAAYGVREKTMTLPSSLDATDAARWGAYQVSKYKDPVQKAKVNELELSQSLIKAVGKARIIDLAGVSNEYHIKKVSYSVNAGGRVVCNMELGEQFFPVEKQILNMMRDIQNEVELQRANVKQLSA